MAVIKKNILRRLHTDILSLFNSLKERQWGLVRRGDQIQREGTNLMQDSGELVAKDDQGNIHVFPEERTIDRKIKAHDLQGVLEADNESTIGINAIPFLKHPNYYGDSTNDYGFYISSSGIRARKGISNDHDGRTLKMSYNMLRYSSNYGTVKGSLEFNDDGSVQAYMSEKENITNDKDLTTREFVVDYVANNSGSNSGLASVKTESEFLDAIADNNIRNIWIDYKYSLGINATNIAANGEKVIYGSTITFSGDSVNFSKSDLFFRNEVAFTTKAINLTENVDLFFTKVSWVQDTVLTTSSNTSFRYECGPHLYRITHNGSGFFGIKYWSGAKNESFTSTFMWGVEGTYTSTTETSTKPSDEYLLKLFNTGNPYLEKMSDSMRLRVRGKLSAKTHPGYWRVFVCVNPGSYEKIVNSGLHAGDDNGFQLDLGNKSLDDVNGINVWIVYYADSSGTIPVVRTATTPQVYMSVDMINY